MEQKREQNAARYGTSSGALICPECRLVLPAEKQICARDGSRGVPRVPAESVTGYEFIDLIGAGGMGVVYRARNMQLDRPVAIKLLPPGLADETALLRFFSEAKAMGKLRHPNIVQIEDFGILPSGTAYMVLDYIDGITLRQFINQKKRISFDEFCNVFQQCTDALRHAHDNKILHRDIKPTNIMMRGKPFEVTILDFGIAKVQESAEGRLDLTRTGEVVGSPLYLSPEMITGEELNESSDVYSLGCVMYEVLAGRSPFERATVLATISSHLTDPVAPLSSTIDFAPAVDPIIRKCLAKEQKKRYANMTELGAALKTVRGHGASSKPFPIKAIAITCSILCLFGMLIFLFFRSQPGASTDNSPAIQKPASGSVSETASVLQSRSLDQDNIDGLQIIGKLDPGERLKLKLKDLKDERTIDLGGMFLEDDDLQKLDNFKNVTSLRLDNDKVGDIGLTHIVHLPLTALRVNETRITDKGLAMICKIKSLNFLECEKNRVGNEGVEFLCTLPQLHLLSLDNTRINDAGVQRLAQIKTLKVLSLNSNAVRDRSMPAIASLPDLQQLSLSGTKVTGAGVAPLAKCRSLKLLQLARMPIDNSVFDSLQDSNLVSLSLNDTRVSDAGLMKAAKLKHLKNLILTRGLITPYAVEQLKEARPDISISLGVKNQIQDSIPISPDSKN